MKDRKLIYIDLETTGLDSKKNGVWSIAGLIEINKEQKEIFNFKTQPFPDDEIDDEALAHGHITRADLETFKKPDFVFKSLVALLDKYIDKYTSSDKFVWVGYNTKFDMDFLREWFFKNKCKYFGSYFTYYSMDIYGITSMLWHYGLLDTENLKQETVAAHFGIEYEAHIAKEDVIACRKIYYKCAEILKLT